MVYGCGHIKLSISLIQLKPTTFKSSLRSIIDFHTVDSFQSLPPIILNNWVHSILSGKKNPSVGLNIETSLLLKKYLTRKLVGAGEYFRKVSLYICIITFCQCLSCQKKRLLALMGIGSILAWLFNIHCPSTSGKEGKTCRFVCAFCLLTTSTCAYTTWI